MKQEIRSPGCARKALRRDNPWLAAAFGLPEEASG